MRHFFQVVSAVVFLFSTACAHAGEKPLTVSIVTLIANKDQFDGKLIEFSGYFSLTFEDHAVYLDEASYAHQFTENSIWIEIDDEQLEKFSKYNRHYGYVVGLFSATKCGHLCLYSGSLKFERLGLMY